MPPKPHLAKIMITDWHTILLLLVAVWSAIWPFLNPAHFQLQNALDSAAIAIIAFVFAHGYSSLKQLTLTVDGTATTRMPAADPLQRRPGGDSLNPYH